VRIGDGPAAVIGDEGRNHATDIFVGKARPVGRSVSQKTCLVEVSREHVDRVRLYNLPRIKKGHPRIETTIGPGIFISPDSRTCFFRKEKR